ncbi:MAG: helix-turn-helix domain-containing protein [Actinomycetota bacterium]|nr:helix-turn-helix domain-containing protein [Actinomycetota bacterium]
MNEEFGRRVRELREHKKATDPSFSLRRFAQAVGLSATFVSRMETGEAQPPGAEKVKSMAYLLGADADELLALAGKVDPELPEIIRKQPRAMADLLRTARDQGLTEEEILSVTEELKSRRSGGDRA